VSSLSIGNFIKKIKKIGSVRLGAMTHVYDPSFSEE
jgi:hypothetical protein